MFPSSFQSEGCLLPSSVPSHFEGFYRAALRPLPGSRVRSSVLLAAYAAWAAQHGHPSISYNQLRRFMRATGHARTKSNGIQYLDVALAVDAPGLVDGFRLVTVRDELGGAQADAMMHKLDAALQMLVEVRAALQ